MSDDAHQQPLTQDDEPTKVEDANAPINIKVPIFFSFIRRVSQFAGYFSCVFSIFIHQVVSSTGEEVFFKIKRSTKLTKLQGAYANKVGKDVGSIRSVSFFIRI